MYASVQTVYGVQGQFSYKTAMLGADRRGIFGCICIFPLKQVNISPKNMTTYKVQAGRGLNLINFI